MFPTSNVRTLPTERKKMKPLSPPWQISVSYDENPVHWSKNYYDELEAHQEFAKFVDHGFANEFATVNLQTPSLKMYTKVIYRGGKVTVK
jgi:hypothetical protein